MSWADFKQLILLMNWQTDIYHTCTHTYISWKFRPLSFIILSHHFFAFEVTRYISFPSSPHWSQNETPLHYRSNTLLYSKGDHGYWRAGTHTIDLERGMEILTWFPARHFNSEVLDPLFWWLLPIQLTTPFQKFWWRLYLRERAVSEASPGALLMAVWSYSSLQSLYAANLHLHSQHCHWKKKAFCSEPLWKNENKGVLMRRPNKWSLPLPLPGWN